MTDQTPNMTQQDGEPFIPAHYMLILAALGFIVAAGVFLTQPSFTVVGWGGLGIMLLSLVAWVLIAPQEAKAVLTGRTARFGGTSILVTVIFVGVLIAIYVLLRQANLRTDLTESNQFSLTEESRQAVSSLGADPNLPQVQILAFYGTTQAGRRDQDTLLFEDYKTASNGKITYTFIDPDREPLTVTQYGITTPGQIAVVATGEDGQPDATNAELVNFVSQDGLTNAILKAAASGDFRAYFLTVDGGIPLSSMGLLQENLERLDWLSQEVPIFQLTGADAEIVLNDPAADGEVMVIAGGDTPLNDDSLKIITDFVDAGGSLVIFAAPNVQPAQSASGIQSNQALALAPNMADYLYNSFGLRFRDDVVLDASLSLGSPLIPVATDYSATSYITDTFPPGQSAVVFELPHSIEIAPTLPANVSVEELIRSSTESYSKTDVQALLEGGSTDVAETDARGPFVLAASAENSETGARVVLFGSASVPVDSFALGNSLVNLQASFNSLVWTTRFNDFFSRVNIQSAIRPQDTGVFADDQTLRNINLLTTFALPFGILLAGFLVWWNNRERARS